MYQVLDLFGDREHKNTLFRSLLKKMLAVHYYSLYAAIFRRFSLVVLHALLQMACCLEWNVNCRGIAFKGRHKLWGF